MQAQGKESNRSASATDADLLRYYLAVMAHDLGHVAMDLRNISASLEYQVKRGAPIEQQGLLDNISTVADNLLRTSRSMRFFAAEDKEIVCDFLDNIWRPTIAFLSDFYRWPDLGGRSTDQGLRELPKVNIRPSPCCLALISFLAAIEARAVECAVNTSEQRVIVRILCESSAEKLTTKSLRRLLKKFDMAGVPADVSLIEEDYVLTLDLKVAADDSLHR